MFTCIHGLDFQRLLDYSTCSTCNGVPDSTLDDTIEPGRVIAWFTPSVEARTRGIVKYSTDLTPCPAVHDPQYTQPRYRRSFNGYRTVQVPADDPQEIRVREAVRDFGLLTRNRDLKYATGIGMDYDAFVWGIVAPEPDHLAVEGATLPSDISSTRGAQRPHDLAGIRAWRSGR